MRPVQLALTVLSIILLITAFRFLTPTSSSDDWPAYGGSTEGNRYSTLQQINRENVQNLKLAWAYDTDKEGGNQCQPIMVGGILYGTTSSMKLFALDAATGCERWRFDPFADTTKMRTGHPIRGVLYWADGADKRVLYSVGSWLYALNAETGEPIKTFGQNGASDLYQGLGDEKTLGHDPRPYRISITTPGVIFEDLLITGSSVSEGGDALPGYIRAFNVRTGKLAWVFHTIPLPGETGYETWPKDAYRKLGGANCWAGLVVDPRRGMVYAGTGSPSVDFYGGARKGQNLFANCMLALDARTGKRKWHYQTVHHDLWDRDAPCPPNLLTVTHNGRRVDAVAQATKDGNVFVFDRDTGKPLFPVQEKPVPTSPALPGEHPWPTQPMPAKPAPFSYQVVNEAMLTTRTPEARAFALKHYRDSQLGQNHPLPNKKGSLVYGIGGGAEWGGTAVDPDGVFYVNGNNMLWWVQMRDNPALKSAKTQTRGLALFNQNCSACHAIGNKARTQTAGTYSNLTDVDKRLTAEQVQTILANGRGRMPSFGHLPKTDRDALLSYLLKLDAKPASASASNDIHTDRVTSQPANRDGFPYEPPYLSNGYEQFRDADGYPAVKAPWGTLNAIDLNTGEYRWRVPLGEHPELTKQGVAPTGTENHGGPLVTAGGLLFIAATYDEHLRAFDTRTGKIVWQAKLPAGGFATPITYQVDGRQYVVIAACGGRYGLAGGSKFVAFALP